MELNLKSQLTVFLKAEEEENIFYFFSKISDVKELSRYHGYTYGAIQNTRIVESSITRRLRKELPLITNIRELIHYLFLDGVNSMSRKLIEVRISELLPEVESVSTLKEYLECLKSSQKTYYLVKTRLIELLKPYMNEIKHFSTLERLRSEYSFDFELIEIIEIQMAEVLKKEIPEIFDLSVLIKYWKYAYFSNEVEKLIRVQIEKVIKNVPQKGLDGFLEVIKEKNFIPVDFFPFIKKKAQEMVETI